ncbi:UNVERIFIED_CONTAM: hypothetical protein RMT77_006589 [Armadillidium vulgare]
MTEQLVNEAFGNILPSTNFALTKGLLLSSFFFSIKPPITMDHPNAKVLKTEYDFIVVGAGSAGSVISSRLSENNNFEVLLLEAGGDENEISETPALAPFLQLTDLDWQFKVQPSSGSCLGMVNKTCFYPRGKVLGGSSTINYFYYVRGNKNDYDNWADAGNYGWSYEDVLPYFKKSEDNRNPLYAQNERYHSTNGELTVSDPSYTTPLADIFLRAGRELGYSNGDYNAQNQTTFSMPQLTIRDGSRCSASKAFLHPASKFKNLDIAKFAHVTKILIDPESKRAYGVRYYRYGAYHEVYAKKEVILSAGAINTPQLLMLSGIGPKDHLKELDIKLIKNLPVGHNLQDHIAFPLTFLTDKSVTFIPEREINLLANMTYDVYKKGPLSSPLALDGHAFVNSRYQDPKESYPDLQIVLVASSPATDGSVRREKANLSDELFNAIYLPIASKESFEMFVFLNRPKSIGRLLLRSKNHFDKPLVKPNYFEDYDDVRRLIDGGRIGLKIIETKAFKEINAKYHLAPIPTCPNAKALSDEYFECLMRYNTVAVFHATGTAKMGPDNDSSAVIDPELRVRGISGLRVADASIMPNIITGNLNAPTIMIGEKASDLIKKIWAE